MSNRPTMAPMMACRTEPMPLTMAIRQLPMVRKMDANCEVLAVVTKKKLVCVGKLYTRDDGTHFGSWCVVVVAGLGGLEVVVDCLRYV
jgi:hypothetical protein